MSIKIALTKPGFNVLTETNPDNMIFSSEYNTLKYSISGSLSVNVSAGAGVYYIQRNSVVHNLGFLPFYVTFAFQPKVQVGYAPVGINYDFPDDGPGNGWFRHLRSWVTTTRLWVAAEGSRDAASESYTAIFHYKIYRNVLNI